MWKSCWSKIVLLLVRRRRTMIYDAFKQSPPMFSCELEGVGGALEWRWHLRWPTPPLQTPGISASFPTRSGQHSRPLRRICEDKLAETEEMRGELWGAYTVWWISLESCVAERWRGNLNNKYWVEAKHSTFTNLLLILFHTMTVVF